MNKQEAIKQAYGEHWEIIKHYIDDNGWASYPYIQAHELGEFKEDCMFLRPKSLQGIENNNGWVKIESENDLPKEFTECHFKIKKDPDIQVGAYVPHKNNFVGLDDDYFIMEISHYKPIEKPKPPIY